MQCSYVKPHDVLDKNVHSIELYADKFSFSSRIMDYMYKAGELVHSFKL